MTPVAVLVHASRTRPQLGAGGGATIALEAAVGCASRSRGRHDVRRLVVLAADGGVAVQEHHYRNLFIMGLLSFISMYVLMYAMVDRFGNVYSSVNQAYMAGLMTAPMLVIELVIMRGMYHNRRLNALVAGASVVAGVACFLFIRQQTGVADQQFLRSMIPHHSGAILMCEEAQLRDPELRRLCANIIASQQREIDQMTAMLQGRR